MSSAASLQPAVVDAGNPTEPRHTDSTGLAVLGETVQHADPQVRTRLRRVNLLR